ncbi:MAG: hypothetical protein KGL39_17445 [Patescibacteria group bacterium]|nr:hypothetical protein [Patescibacteria group bacterium]
MIRLVDHTGRPARPPLEYPSYDDIPPGMRDLWPRESEEPGPHQSTVNHWIEVEAFEDMRHYGPVPEPEPIPVAWEGQTYEAPAKAAVDGTLFGGARPWD